MFVRAVKNNKGTKIPTSAHLLSHIVTNPVSLNTVSLSTLDRLMRKLSLI